jgi:hypothetical protein
MGVGAELKKEVDINLNDKKICTRLIVKSQENQARLQKYMGHGKRKPIAVSIKRYIWKRDQGCCQFKNPATGHPCGSKFFIEIDHIKRVRHGGDNDPTNLRLLCKAHNLWRS